MEVIDLVKYLFLEGGEYCVDGGGEVGGGGGFDDGGVRGGFDGRGDFGSK